jgi:hypothetical protein
VSSRTGVYLEVGAKRVFASAADWPGWSRGGKSEQEALEVLAAYAPRYTRVVKLPKDATDFEVVERQKGNASTDFGVPALPAKAESKKPTARETERLISILEACWKYLDQVRAKVPQELRKGPRGGGRDRDKMYTHVLDAELAYASALRVKLKAPDRNALLAALRHRNPDARWPVAYAIRRIAWHALDHAWEMEDRVP